jgi:hypothetical protein
VRELEKLSGIKPLVLQFTPGVVPVEKDSVSAYIPENLRSNDGETAYTSTMQLISTKEIYAERETLNLQSQNLFKNHDITNKTFIPTENNNVFLLPIKLTLVIINTTSLHKTLKSVEEARKKNTDNTIQYRVPVSSNFSDVLHHFCNKPFTYVGFTLQSGYLYYVFIERPAIFFENVKAYLEAFPVSEIQESMQSLHTSPCI